MHPLLRQVVEGQRVGVVRNKNQVGIGKEKKYANRQIKIQKRQTACQCQKIEWEAIDRQ
jgi:hypothetical protein